MKKKMLVIGGTGFLGQHLLEGFNQNQESCPFALAFTHHTARPPALLLEAIPQAIPFRIDLKTGHGFADISEKFGQPDVVVNCAAMSVPRACEVDPDGAMSINVPSALVEWISSFGNGNVLLIHLSTDQVYEGAKSFYKEEDETVPVNVYGRSKVAAEQLLIKAAWLNFVVLRSSIIFGPQTASPVSKPLFIQWMDSVLAKGEAVEFFHDEYRCPVYVKDLVTIIQTLANRWISEGEPMKVFLNVGGPDRLSRLQMAETVADIRAYKTSSIKAVSASSVDRGVNSPADTSMDISKLVQMLGISPTNFSDGVRFTLDHC